MASSSSSSSSSLSILVLFVLFSLFKPSFSATCKSNPTFSTNFENCNDLPTLDAILHWTYNQAQSSLSIAFTAPAPSPNGWVAWALNPTSTGMVGAQALIAFKPTPASPISASTYDIKSYGSLIKGPISYNVTDISASSTGAEITIFATWGLPIGSSEVNQVWQVGPVVNGRFGKHEFKPANLESGMTLDLGSGAIPTISEAPAAAPVAGSPADSPAESEVGEAAAPGPVKGGAARFGMMSSVGGGVLGAVVASLLL